MLLNFRAKRFHLRHKLAVGQHDNDRDLLIKRFQLTNQSDYAVAGSAGGLDNLLRKIRVVAFITTHTSEENAKSRRERRTRSDRVRAMVEKRLDRETYLALASVLEDSADVASGLGDWERRERPVTDITQRWAVLYITVLKRWPQNLLDLRSKMVAEMFASPAMVSHFLSAARHVVS